MIDESSISDREEPSAGILGQAVSRPRGGGAQQRFLRRVFTQVKGTVPSYERAKDLRRELAQQALDIVSRAHISVPASWRTGQTSTALCDANGYAATISSARASLSQSSMKKLDTNSF